MEELARGATNAEIATHLNLCAATAKTHLARICRKLQTNSRYKALAICLANKWIHVTPDNGDWAIIKPPLRSAKHGMAWTDNRRRVYILIAAGDNLPEIADKLHTTVAAVNKHLEAVIHLLGVSNRCQVITFAHCQSPVEA